MDIIIDFIVSERFYSPVIIILCSMFIYSMISFVLGKAIVKGQNELEKKRRNTVILLINNIIKYFTVIVAVILILNVFDIDTTTFVTGLGVAGVVIGLGLQDAIKDIIGGINIILENYFVLGDQVKFNDFAGEVVDFGLRSTKIKANSGEVLVLANRLVDRIINLSQKQATIMFEIPTAPECDSKKVQKVLEAIIEKAKTDPNVEAGGCSYTGIEKLDGKAVIYTFKFKCKQGKQIALKSQVLAMVKEAYEKEKLKLF